MTDDENRPDADDAEADTRDAIDYAQGRIELDEYVARVLSRRPYTPTEEGPAIDPVALYDSMDDAGTSLMGSYAWLADHAATEAEAQRWWDAFGAVLAHLPTINARDEAAQREARANYISREQAVRDLVLP